MGVVILWPFIALYKAARKRLVPCVHGTRGAAADILLCGQCREADFEKRFKRDLVEVRQRMEKKAARQRELAIRKKEFLQKARTLAFLQSLEPKVFQGLICAVYRQKGYDVRETSFTKDGGVDGFLVQGARRLVLQCKRFKGDVGEPVVRDLFGTANHHNADGAVLVTTGRVSRPAQMFSQGKSIELIDGQALLGLLEEVNLSENLVPDDFVATLGERPAVLGQDKKTG
jgi:restriction endonuclease Mrr